ncbi:MAG: MarR family transcriptional regulator [Candidatus Dadabacteria bacterium]|nr:MarR family transcriptional regulator [Candidatus Dadabacteria bacterium]NIS08325.1 MarR family transcriptional regulator [Candidatus Dadabacteria bacterium]NIV41749.1 MarR family transcriptional regulator [Candidatus Dadabacteria bacterium]NIX15197.1 MarR family transcriptional regulator [Candidatus Dadabacteria bacterium]NIY21842.1 MarR family transcriptional regulator [Candidatus Dadabacteria bacterium]
MGTKYKGTKREVGSLNAFINLLRAAGSIEGRLSGNLDNFNLTTSQFGVLEALHHLGPLSQKEIGNKILKSGGNITKVVDNLEKKGLVTREKNLKDRRFYNIKLTEKGNILIEKIFPLHVKEIVKEFEILTDTELEKLRRLTRYLGKQKRD